MITITLLQKLCPKTKGEILAKFVGPLEKACKKYEINTPRRVAGFLAQIAHESGDFMFTKENLNYSATALIKTFPKYFPTQILAEQYARKPEKIANRVYANRMGNGPETSGDGFKFCGRGLIQLTGKTNYTALSVFLGMQLDQVIPFLETVDGTVESAGWFWSANKLNRFCDTSDIVGLSRAINGGLNGIDDRKMKYEAVLKLLGN